MAVQVTIYRNEADPRHRHLLHMEILSYLLKLNACAAVTIDAVGGFVGRHRVETAHRLMVRENMLLKQGDLD